MNTKVTIEQNGYWGVIGFISVPIVLVLSVLTMVYLIMKYKGDER